MKKIIFGLCIGVLLLAKTASASLSVSPFYVQFDADSKKRSDIVRITNSSNQVKRYRIKLINYQQMPNGDYKEISEPLTSSPFASPYIGFSPRETELQPRQSQTIRLQRKAMPAAKDGEYVSHLLVQEMPEPHSSEKTKANELKISIKALFGITIPIIIDKGNLSDSASLVSAKIVHSTKNPMAEVVVKRRGTRSFWGTLIVKDGDEEIGRVNNFKIFLSTPQRMLKIPLSQNPTRKVRVILMDVRNDATISSQEI